MGASGKREFLEPAKPPPFVPNAQSPHNLRVVTTSTFSPHFKHGLRGREKRCLIFVTLTGPLERANKALFSALCLTDHETFCATYEQAANALMVACAKRTRELQGIKGTFRWDRYAACSCPCSPGVVFKAEDPAKFGELAGKHFNVEASVPDAAEPKPTTVAHVAENAAGEAGAADG